MSLLVGTTDVTALLKEKYKKLGKGWITLLEVPPSKHMAINTEALKILVNELQYTCIYITLSRPYQDLDKLLNSKGINTKSIYYIDAISQLYGTAEKPTNRCAYVSGPLDIDSITNTMRKSMQQLPNKKCVFLDSITTVLLYNSLSRTIRFSKFLTQNLKSLGVDGVMVSIAKGPATESLIKELTPLCDEVLSIQGKDADEANEGLKKR
jgi:hypothetical protein